MQTIQFLTHAHAADQISLSLSLRRRAQSDKRGLKNVSQEKKVR